MSQRKLTAQRQLLVVVLVVIILVPLLLFVQGTAMNRSLAEKASERAVDQIMSELERRGLALQKDDWLSYYWWRMSLRTGRERTELSGAFNPGALPPDPAVTLASGRGGKKVLMRVTLADTREELMRKFADIVRQGGEPVLVLPIPSAASQAAQPLPIAPVSEGISHLVAEFTQSNNRSLLKTALVGTVLLLGLGACIVFLSERGRKLQAQLERERGLAYVGTLAAGLAHEIRNPLSSVKMNIQMIEQKLSSLDPQQYPYLNTKVHRILQETSRLEDSITDFLRFARPAPLTKKPEALNEVVDEAVDFLAPECEQAQIELVKHYAEDLPRVKLDRAQFGRALQNLIINARQALADRGGRIELSTRRNGRCAEVTVADNGPGVPSELREKVFDAFFTTKPNGTGLGLSMVRQIAEAHGGQARLQDSDRPGAAFTISVPL